MACSSGKTIAQWACSVESFSSEYNSEGWSADQILGPPKVYPEYGDLHGAWASEECNLREFIEISFERSVVPSEIKIYETYNAGGISRILARDPTNQWIVLYTAPRLECIKQSRIFCPTITGCNFSTRNLRIEIDCSFSCDWVEIDAVQLIGSLTGKGLPVSSKRKDSPKLSLWVEEVTNYSTQYNNSGWSARSVIGEPKVYPRYGDIHGSWATKVTDAHQFIEVKFHEKLILQEINIYETYHAGGVKRVLAKDPAGKWLKLYETNQVQNIAKSRIFSPTFTPPKFPVDELRIDLDCTKCGSWVEIDAVNIVGQAAISLTPLSSSFLQLVNNRMFSDVEIIIDGVSFYAHKGILVARSTFFKSIFVDGNVPASAQQQQKVPSSQPLQSPAQAEDGPPSYDSLFGPPPTSQKTPTAPPKEQLYGEDSGARDIAPVQAETKTTLPVFSSGGPLVLHNVTSDVFWIILYFIYTEEIPDMIVTSDAPLEISPLCLVRAFRAADDFDLPGLKPLCMNRLCTLTPIAVDNVVDVFVEAMRQPVQELISQVAQQIVMQNRDAVKSQSKFRQLPKDVQMMLLSGPDIKNMDLKSVKRTSSETCCLQ
uniref:Uncharacterized protein LOC111118373 isoform X1 n=1 Tax=Crassostrea virginica TaxID=6565 RepID=A0A8B8CCT9_CRAVI|nr:uncharacterized protein LOC111118373 isoform X1 [Crassostrea virginica]XP_022313502.1 uncharacterized protein LOC111118373 isoform X1 [Crassostrea virginica]